MWFVRRRRAKRRPFWSGRHQRRGARFHGEGELPDEKLPLPGVFDMFTNPDAGEPGFNRFHDDRSSAATGGLLLLALLPAIGLLHWLVARHVLPWLVPLVAANARLLLGVAAALAGLVALDQLHRPWYVVLQRQGLADAPRRVWRVQGWRDRPPRRGDPDHRRSPLRSPQATAAAALAIARRWTTGVPQAMASTIAIPRG